MNTDIVERFVATVTNGSLESATALLSANSNLALARDQTGATALLRIAGLPRSSAILSRLIEQGADPNAESREGVTAIGNVINLHNELCNTLDDLRILLRSGADPNKVVQGGYTALQLAIALGKLEHARLLLEAGAEPSKKSNDAWPEDAFAIAKKCRDKAALELLARYGPNGE